MGFVLGIIYLVVTYLTAPALFGSLARFRIELILAILILIVSLPALMRSYLSRTAQSFAVLGLSIGAFLSVLTSFRWIGGALEGFMDCLPIIYGFILLCLHFNSKKRLKILVAMFLFICVFVIAHGATDLIHGVPSYGPSLSEETHDADLDRWDIEHPYVFAMRIGEGKWIYRLRGLGTINDPNDFGQLLVSVIPLTFIFWKSKRALSNLFMVILPVLVLVAGVFMTHSRGALIALTAILLIAVRKRIGTIPAAVLAGLLFAGAMALQFTGGRNISASAGEDRTALWGEAFANFKTHPLFGVGLNALSDYMDNHLTAHNSILVCAAELGSFGLYFWSLFLLSTARDSLTLSSSRRVADAVPIQQEQAPAFPYPMKRVESIEREEVLRLGKIIFLSFAAFLVAGVFISRAIVITLFIQGGMAEVVYQMALDRGMVGPRMRLSRMLGYSAILAAGLLVVMYIVVRALNLLR